jgi:hypothetical protein
MSIPRSHKTDRKMNLGKIIEQKNEDDSEQQSMTELKKSNNTTGSECKPREENIQNAE